MMVVRIIVSSFLTLFLVPGFGQLNHQLLLSGSGGDLPAFCNGISVNTTGYAEGFEADFGDWVQVVGDDEDWIRNSGSTPSSGTGPSSAIEGSFYIFTEASTVFNKEIILETEGCFFIDSGAELLEFQRHMYGGDMGTLKIQVSTDGSTYTDEFTSSGDQGNTWVSDDVSLYSYAGQHVKIRIHGLTGSGYQSDISVDDVSFSAATPPSAPVADFSASSTTISEGGNIDFTDASTNTPTSWSWTFQGGSPGTSTAENPTGITYSTAGTYDVTLVATNSQGSDTETKVDFITVNAGFNDPTDIADIVVWFDGSDPEGDGTPPSNGTSLATWHDKSGNNNDATQGTSTYQPQFLTNQQNGLGGVDFAFDYMTTGAITAMNTDVFTSFVVYETDDPSTVQIAYNNSYSSGVGNTISANLYHSVFTGGSLYKSNVRSSAPSYVGVDGSSADSSPNYHTAQVTSGDVFQYWIDGVSQGTNTPANAAPSGHQGLFIGAQYDNSKQLNGRVFEVIYYARVLTSQEISDVETWLANKWNL